MTEEREKELLRHVPSLGCMAEIASFRESVIKNDGAIPSRLLAALIQQAARMGHK